MIRHPRWNTAALHGYKLLFVAILLASLDWLRQQLCQMVPTQAHDMSNLTSIDEGSALIHNTPGRLQVGLLSGRLAVTSPKSMRPSEPSEELCLV
jgi:hypothetical protein